MAHDCPAEAVAMQVSAHEGIWDTMPATSWAATEVAAATAAMRASEKRMVKIFWGVVKSLTWLLAWTVEGGDLSVG